MPIWKHVLENLTAIASLVLMPYVFIALGLGVLYFLHKHGHHHQHHAAH